MGADNKTGTKTSISAYAQNLCFPDKKLLNKQEPFFAKIIIYKFTTFIYFTLQINLVIGDKVLESLSWSILKKASLKNEKKFLKF